MADNDPNVMQAQLGLMGGSGGTGSMAPFGMPTPMPVPAMMKHPSDAARDAVQMTQTMAMNTMQTTQAVNMAAMGPMGSMGGGAGGGWGLNSFAQQYRQNMAGIQQQQLNPWMAGSMASMMGSGGYQAGMMPSPIQMTQPAMGIYRPPPMMPMGQVPPVPPMPMFPTPFTPNAPSPMFSTSFDRNAQLGDMRGVQNTAFALAAPGVAARAGTAAAGGWAGAGLGAHMGARFGATGAAIGGMVGGFAGMMGAEHFAGAGVQGLVDQMNPLDRMARHTAQIRGMSQEFVVGGGGLGNTGRGLSHGASAHLGRQLNSLAGDSGFQRQTGSQFSSQDLMKITQVSGQQGMLDMAQNPEQITGQIKNIAKALTAFMKMAGEPDVTAALRQMGQMRQMGLSLGETMQATQQAKHFSRMSGTSVRGVMEGGGLPGAMVFQQQGLSAGLGFNVGMGSLGMARQAVAGGSFTTQQLAMLGGTQGVAQNNMEMSASMLKQPLLAAAMSGFGAGGTFGLNGGNMQQMSRGGMGIQQMATMGVNNMLSAVNKGGVSAIGAFQMQQGELEDQMGRALGPEGIKMMGFQQIRNTRQMLGLKGPGGTFGAAKAMGMSDDQAKQATLEMSSPEFFQNMQRQIHITRQEARAEARERRQETSPTLMDKFAERSDTVRGARGALRNVGVGFDDLMEGASSALARSGEEGAANKSGQTVIRQGRSLLSQNPLESRMVNRITMKEMREAGVFKDRGGNSDAIFRTGEGRGVGHSETVSNIRREVFGGDAFDLKQMREAQGGAKAFFGGGNMEAVARMVTFGAGFDNADQNDETRADIQRGSEASMRGLKASSGERASSQRSLQKGLGVDKKTASKVSMELSKELARIAKEKSKGAGTLLAEGGQLTGKDWDAAMAAVAAKTGVPIEKLTANKQALEKSSTQMAQALAGTSAGAIRGTDIVNKGSLLKSIEDGAQAQVDRGIRLMGDEGGVLSDSGIGGDASRREAMMQKIFSEDESPEVGRLATLMAAAQTGDEKAVAALGKATEKLGGTAEGQDILKRASAMQKSFGSDNDMAVRLGKGGMALNADTFAREQKGFHAEKAARIYRSGLSEIADSDLLAAGDDARNVLTAAGRDGKGLSGKSVALAKEYNARGTSDERKAELEESFEQIASGRGHAEESSLFGGLMDAAADKMAEFKSEMVGNEAAAASADFPEAVEAFAKASRSLERAADALGTRLGDGVNTWGQ